MTPSLRDRQRLETHAAIERAAVALAVEDGVAAVTAQRIALRAGVSQRTFFNHFRTKEEALVPSIPPFREDEELTFIGAHEPDLLTALQRLLFTHLDEHLRTAPEGPRDRFALLQDNPELLGRLLQVFAEFDGRVLGLIARRLGRDESDLFCRVASTCAMAVVRAVFDHHRRTAPEGPLPSDQEFAEAFTHLRALTASA